MPKHLIARAYLGVALAGTFGCQSSDASTTDDVLPVTTPDGGGGAADGGAGLYGDAGTAPWDAYVPVGSFGDASVYDASTTSDAASGSDGSTAVPDAAVASGTLKPKCMKKDSQLIIIGDSYISWTSHSFPTHIKEESGQNWRMEAVGGFSLGSGGIGSIPGEFDSAIALDPDAHTVLMDGGGNDILIPDITRAAPIECTSKGASKKANCQGIVKTAVDAANVLIKKAADKGIRDVVYFFYPHVPANTILSGDSPDEILDYALPLVRKVCDDAVTLSGGKLRCTFIDMVPIFAGHKDWFNEDIHENDTGAKAMAKEIWRVMSTKCIGQKGPKDCCE